MRSKQYGVMRYYYELLICTYQADAVLEGNNEVD